MKEDKAKGSLNMRLVHKMVKMSFGYFYQVLCVVFMLIGVVLFQSTNVMREEFGGKIDKGQDLTAISIKFTLYSFACNVFGITSAYMIFFGTL